jgi:hypothetical protein
MKSLQILLLAITSLFFSNCAHWYGLVDGENYSESIKSSKPKPIGSYESGTWGAYSYKAYARSVTLKAPMGVMRVYEVEVFDVDQNGRFDTVFALYDGKWRYGCTKEMKIKYPMVDSGLSSGFVMKYIKEATRIKWSITKRNAEKKRQARILEEKKKKPQEQAETPASPPNLRQRNPENPYNRWYGGDYDQ